MAAAGNVLHYILWNLKALRTANAGISLSEAEASVASPFTSKVCVRNGQQLYLHELCVCHAIIVNC